MTARPISPSTAFALVAALLTTLLVGAAARRGAAEPGDTLREAVQKGARFLSADVVKFTKEQFAEQPPCIACHRNGISLYGLARARSRGFDTRTSITGASLDAVEVIRQSLQRAQLSNGRFFNGTDDIEGSYVVSGHSYALFGAAGYDLYGSSGAMETNLIRGADWALGRQASDGRWVEDNLVGSQPADYGTVGTTVRMMVGIAQARTHVQDDATRLQRYGTALGRAADWLAGRKDDAYANQPLGDIESMDRVFKVAYGLLGMRAAGRDAANPAFRALRDRLLASISTVVGVGWGGSPDEVPDAFNTGIALFALAESGMDPNDNRLLAAREWLNETQKRDDILNSGGGYWSDAGGSIDTRTTFAMLGLGTVGEGVRLTHLDTAERALLAGSPDAQVQTFRLRLENTSTTGRAGTFELRVRSGLPNWTATLNTTRVFLEAGASDESILLTVTAPPALAQGISASLAVLAISTSDQKIHASASARFQTGPPLAPPPDTGNPTETVLRAGGGVTLLVGQPFTFRATVRDLAASRAVRGPGSGIVTFAVDGATLGGSDDPDGDGNFTLTWTPPADWFPKGGNLLTVTYSGIDRGEGGTDLQPSETGGICSIRTNSFSITSITPASGIQGQTLAVKITGSGFNARTWPAFSGSGVELNAGVSIIDTEISAGIGIALNAHATRRDVHVVGPDLETVTLRNAFTVREAPAPTIAEVTPARVSVGRSATLTLRGTGFLSGARADFYDDPTIRQTAPAELVSAREMRVFIEVAADAWIGPRSVRVRNVSGLATEPPGTFEVAMPPPVITSVTPDSGQREETLELVIDGSDFQPGAGVNISGNGVVIGEIREASATRFRLAVEIGASADLGSRDIYVTNPDGQSAIAEGAFEVLPLPPPRVDTVSPSSARQGATLDVTIDGASFREGAALAFPGGGITVNAAQVAPTRIVATITIAASAAAGPRSVSVTNPDGQEGVKEAAFEVIPNAPPPSITSVTPSKGRQGQTLDLAISGSGFQEGAAVGFSGQGIARNGDPVVVATEIRLNITIAESAATGARTLTVTNPDGNRATATFTVERKGAPLAVDRTSVPFGNVSVRSRKPKSEPLKLTNRGASRLTVQVTRPGAPFGLRPDAAALTLEPGATKTVKVLFAPKKVKNGYKGRILFTTSGASSQKISVRLTGNGVR